MQAGPAHVVPRRSGSPASRGGRGGEVRDAARVPGEVRRLEVDQVGHRLEHAVQLGAVDPPGQARLGGEDRRPSSPPRPDRRAPASACSQNRSATTPGRTSAGVLAGRDLRGLDAVLPGERPRSGRQLDQPRRQRDVVAAQVPRLALAVPLLVGLADSDAHRASEPDPLGELRRPAGSGWQEAVTSSRCPAAGTSPAAGPVRPLPCEPTRRSRYAAICGGALAEQSRTRRP